MVLWVKCVLIHLNCSQRSDVSRIYHLVQVDRSGTLDPILLSRSLEPSISNLTPHRCKDLLYIQIFVEAFDVTFLIQILHQTSGVPPFFLFEGKIFPLKAERKRKQPKWNAKKELKGKGQKENSKKVPKKEDSL